MPYIKTNWEDRLTEKPNQYNMVSNGDGTTTITEAPGAVYVPGTPINADNLNKLEEGVRSVTELVETSKIGGLNLLDNANFDMGYYGKYPLSNANADLVSIATGKVLRVSKNSGSLSTISFNIPASVADEFKPNEDFTLSMRYTNNATVTIDGNSNVTIVDGPKVLSPTNSFQKIDVKMKFSNTSSVKGIVFKIEGTTNQVMDIDWLCIRVGESGGEWVPSKNDLMLYSNELVSALSVDFNLFNNPGKFMIPASIPTIRNAPSGFDANKMSFLDVMTWDYSGTSNLIQRLQQIDSNKVWYRSINGETFGTWNTSDTPLATLSDALSGTSNSVVMTPLRVNEYMRFKSLNGYSDFNDIVFSSRNLLNGNVITNNTPSGFDSTRLSYLEVLANYENNIPVQILHQPYNGRTWIRMRVSNQSTSAWTSWRRLDNEVSATSVAQAGTDDTTLMTPLKVSESMRFRNFSGVSDFNSITNSGRYYLGYGLTANTPPGYNPSNLSYLEVLNRTADVTPVQRLYQPQLGLSWSRSKNGNTESAPWTPWKFDSFEIATQTQAQEGTDNTAVMTPLRVYENIASKSTAVTDLDNLLRAGSYFIGSTAGIVNKPPNTSTTSAHVIVYNNLSQNIPTQLYLSVNEGRYFIRSRTGYLATDTWHPWRELGRNISTSAQAKTGTDDSTVMSPVKVKESINNSPIARYGTATGTNSLTINATPGFDNLYPGLTIKFKAENTNTSTVVANVNSKGVKNILRGDGTAAQPGDFKSGSMYEITYDGVNFYLVKGGGGDVKQYVLSNLPFRKDENSDGSILISDIIVNAPFIPKQAYIEFSGSNGLRVRRNASVANWSGMLGLGNIATTIGSVLVDEMNLSIKSEFVANSLGNVTLSVFVDGGATFNFSLETATRVVLTG